MGRLRLHARQPARRHARVVVSPRGMWPVVHCRAPHEDARDPGNLRVVEGSIMRSETRSRTQRLETAPSEVIDRERVIRFTWQGRLFSAYAGDTIASALAAEGVQTFSRSFKYHRRRGLLCVSGDCPNCLVHVDGEPNVRACRTKVEPGMRVRAQNAWPTLDLDVMAATQLVGRFLPPGFYYKTFKRPRALWPFYEDVLRHAAGLGEVDPDREPGRFDKVYK